MHEPLLGSSDLIWSTNQRNIKYYMQNGVSLEPKETNSLCNFMMIPPGPSLYNWLLQLDQSTFVEEGTIYIYVLT
jgi:hypothetical protein